MPLIFTTKALIMTDLIERLNSFPNVVHRPSDAKTPHEQASTIEALKAENARLREALESIAADGNNIAWELARYALEGPHD